MKDYPGVLPDRPNHERGCLFRYGAVSDSGAINCSCPHKDEPDAIVSPWPEDDEHARRWTAAHDVHVYPIDGDATEMLQMALNKAGEHGVVHLHQGEYRVSAPLWKRIAYGIKRLFE